MAIPRDRVIARLRTVAEQTFNCPPDLIGEQTVAADVPGWDSLSHTIFIMNVEHEFGIEFDVATIQSFSCVSDMIDAIEKVAA